MFSIAKVVGVGPDWNNLFSAVTGAAAPAAAMAAVGTATAGPSTSHDVSGESAEQIEREQHAARSAAIEAVDRIDQDAEHEPVPHILRPHSSWCAGRAGSGPARE